MASADTYINREIMVGDKPFIIKQRKSDGWMDATALCKAGNKQWSNYFQNKNTQEFLEALKADVGGEVIELNVNSSKDKRSTWVHKHVAVNLAAWISPKFAVQVSKWVVDIIEGNLDGVLPDLMRNHDKANHTTSTVLIQSIPMDEKQISLKRQWQEIEAKDLELAEKRMCLAERKRKFDQEEANHRQVTSQKWEEYRDFLKAKGLLDARVEVSIDDQIRNAAYGFDCNRTAAIEDKKEPFVDIMTWLEEHGLRSQPMDKYSSPMGKYAAKLYRETWGQEAKPRKITKFCDNGKREVNLFHREEHADILEKVLGEYKRRFKQ